MILGILGKIASGKSEVLKALQELGYFPIETDEIVHKLYEQGGLGQKVVADVFGMDYIKHDGSVDREKLRQLVFDDEGKLKELNELIHPLVVDEVKKVIERLKSVNLMQAQKIAVAGSYFEEGGLKDLVDDLLWVDRDHREIKHTLVKDRGVPGKEFKKMIDLIEMPEGVRYVLQNNSSLGSLVGKVTDLLR